jgi:hypothetical protein
MKFRQASASKGWEEKLKNEMFIKYVFSKLEYSFTLLHFYYKLRVSLLFEDTHLRHFRWELICSFSLLV